MEFLPLKTIPNANRFRIKFKFQCNVFVPIGYVFPSKLDSGLRAIAGPQKRGSLHLRPYRAGR